MATDAELIAASLGEPELFAGIFDRHYAAVGGFLRRRLGHALADELAAETFLRAFDARGRYDVSRADARPWLFGIAAHLLSHHRRDEERRLRAFARAPMPLDRDRGLEEIDARLDAGMIAAALSAALAGLVAEDREVLLLFAWAELTYREIAEALTIPIGTVRSRMHRAREHVRRGLQRSDAGSALALAADGERTS